MSWRIAPLLSAMALAVCVGSATPALAKGDKHHGPYKHHAKIVRRTVVVREGLPPGLAKRQTLPPGLRKHLRERGELPPGLQKRFYRSYYSGRDLVIVDTRTNRVVRVIYNAR
jgi:hypothetical protein